MMLVLLAAMLQGRGAEAVQLSISSAQVAQPGGSAQLCVSLTTDGQQVAGTQNDLVWDGTCMTLNDGACHPAGSHGKQVNTRIQNSADFRMRVLVLSLTDVDPIDDGVLYCCNVQGEAPPGSCCSISVVNTAASDSQGNAVPGVGGNAGRLCTAGTSGGAVGSVAGAGGSLRQHSGGSAGGVGDMGAGGSMGGSGSIGGSGATGGAAAPAAPANPVAQAPAAPAANPAQPGVSVPGGSGVQVPTAAAPVAAAAPATPAEPAPALRPAAGAAPVAAGAAQTPAATAAATAAVTAAAAPPTPADTPAPTPVPPTRPPASTPTAPHATATATAARGWFGCQIDAGASAAPVLGLALVLAALAQVRRRSASHR